MLCHVRCIDFERLLEIVFALDFLLLQDRKTFDREHQDISSSKVLVEKKNGFGILSFKC